jgi:hypothetical protein
MSELPVGYESDFEPAPMPDDPDTRTNLLKPAPTPEKSVRVPARRHPDKRRLSPARKTSSPTSSRTSTALAWWARSAWDS